MICPRCHGHPHRLDDGCARCDDVGHVREPLALADDGRCDCCGDLVPDLRYGLCADCRCAGCGEPAAPIEFRDSRWCHHCASESGYVAPLYLEAAE